MKTIKRYIATEEEAIKVAKRRASSRYRTQYIYRIEQDGRSAFFIRELPDKTLKPMCKVLYGGSVVSLQEETPT